MNADPRRPSPQHLREAAWRAIRWPSNDEARAAALRCLWRLDAAEAGDAGARRWIECLLAASLLVEDGDGRFHLEHEQPREVAR